jgi:acyl carrier protein
MMQNSELLGQVTDMIINTVNLHHVDRNTITAETSLRDGGLGLDSVDLLEVIVTVEHQFGVKVSDAEVGKKYFRTVGTIAEFIQHTRTVS